MERARELLLNPEIKILAVGAFSLFIYSIMLLLRFRSFFLP